jgi:hypothetical protein
MDDRMVAYCGLTCTDCDAYKATQAEDMDALERMAKEATEQLGEEMTLADAMCDGCRSLTGRRIAYCHQCVIRLCAVQKHIENCAHCEEYPCEKVEGFSKPGSPHRETLDGIWASLHPKN